MSSKNKSREGNLWTKEEVKQLRSLFRNDSNAAVARTLGRTAKAVERKASRLGLTKSRKYLRSLGRVG